MKNRTNRRVHARLESADLADLEIYNTDGSFELRTMGLGRNVGAGGLLLETHMPFEQPNIVVTALELEGEIIETAGRTVHVNPCNTNHYCNGIEFLRNSDSFEFVTELV
jgi:hypothetical protein